MKQLVVSEDQSSLMTSILGDLAAQSEAEAVFLSDAGGNILACVSQPGNNTAQTIAALAAGSFSATRELARMIGETSFSSIYHKGSNSSIFMQTTGGAYLLLVVFGRSTPVGLVKLYVEKTSRELEPLLAGLDAPSTGTATGKPQFEMSGSDQIFKPPVA